MATDKNTDAAPEVSKADDAKAAKDTKAAKKTLTQGDKIDALVKAAKANGWSLPDGLDDED